MNDRRIYHGNNEDVRCDKCGAPVTTGLMAVFCPKRDECAFFVSEEAQTIHELREVFGEPQTTATTNGSPPHG